MVSGYHLVAASFDNHDKLITPSHWDWNSENKEDIPLTKAVSFTWTIYTHISFPSAPSSAAALISLLPQALHQDIQDRSGNPVVNLH